MSIREQIEQWEKDTFSPSATLSTSAGLRKTPEESCSVRTEFRKDTDSIIHSLSFRLLKHKTQVFISTTGEDFRTRLTHTLEVSSVARYIAMTLHLNQDLVEAISLGHDLGHTPFGHVGEEVLDELTPFNFDHSQQSIRVVELLENNGSGLNLTSKVRDGIRQHSKGCSTIESLHNNRDTGPCRASTIEGEVVQFSDWFAYINHDIDDAFNMGLIKENDLPLSSVEVLGKSFHKRRITMLKDVIESSLGKDHIYMSTDIMRAADELRSFLYERVYSLPQISTREVIAREVITFLYEYYLKNYKLVLQEMPYLDKSSPERGVCDYIASLTDIKAQKEYKKFRGT